MIRRKTVLVLGAGASQPYGHYTGLGLRDRIRSYAEIGKNDARKDLFDQCSVSLADLRGLGAAFLGSSFDSIDAYLERQPHRVQTGKIVIAHEICLREDPKLVTGQPNDNWYERLWKHMVDGVTDPSALKNNPLRIVTFNYDRSLEYFLFNAAKYTFGLSDDAALAVSNGLDIQHVYGKLGDFYYKDWASVRAYSIGLDAQRLQMAADGIHIMTDARDNDPLFKKIRDGFDWAEDIAFLGFSFDATNCKRLGLVERIDHRKRNGLPIPDVYATVLDCTNAEVSIAQERVCGSMSWTTFNCKNLAALRQTRLFQ